MRIILHALNCSIAGHKQVLIKSVDADSVVLTVPFFLSLHIDELWVAYGVKTYYRYIPIHICSFKATYEQCKALSFFHAFTCYDIVLSFNTIGQNSAWDAYPHITSKFVSISKHSFKHS